MGATTATAASADDANGGDHRGADARARSRSAAPAYELKRFRVLLANRDEPRARAELLRHFEGMASAIAYRYFAPGMEHDDLAQEGWRGVNEAIDSFRGVPEALPGFVKLVVERRVQQAVTAANRLKHRHLSAAVSLAAPVGDHESDGTLADLLPALNTCPVDRLHQRERVHELFRVVWGECSELEAAVLVAVGAGGGGASYAELVEAGIATNEKQVDNALGRARRKVERALRRLSAEADSVPAPEVAMDSAEIKRLLTPVEHNVLVLAGRHEGNLEYVAQDLRGGEVTYDDEGRPKSIRGRGKVSVEEIEQILAAAKRKIEDAAARRANRNGGGMETSTTNGTAATNGDGGHGRVSEVPRAVSDPPMRGSMIDRKAQIILYLEECGPTRRADLGRAIGIGSQQMSATVASLEREGRIVCRPDGQSPILDLPDRAEEPEDEPQHTGDEHTQAVAEEDVPDFRHGGRVPEEEREDPRAESRERLRDGLDGIGEAADPEPAEERPGWEQALDELAKHLDRRFDEWRDEQREFDAKRDKALDELRERMDGIETTLGEESEADAIAELRSDLEAALAGSKLDNDRPLRDRYIDAMVERIRTVPVVEKHVFDRMEDLAKAEGS